MMRCVRVLLDVRAIYALCGIVCSVVAHELLHVFLHIGDISSVHIFPDWSTVVAIIVNAPTDFDVMQEEAFAYTISTAILFLTMIDVFAIHDSRSETSYRDALLPPESSSSDIDHAAFFALATRAKII